MTYSLVHLLIRNLLLSECILLITAQNVGRYSSTCRKDVECVNDGFCHKASRMCICANRASTYPSCTIHEGSQCREECDPDLQYCDKESEQCFCKYGGLSKDTCCKEKCGEFKVCNEGSCVCAYGTHGSRCRRCMEICSNNEVCRLEGGIYTCVKRKKLNCTQYCGPDSRCRRERGKVICLSCAPGSQLILKKCLSQSWAEWGPWGRCSTTCGPGQQTRTRICSLNQSQLCEGQATESRECFNSQNCYGTLTEWGKWSDCSATCNGGIRSRTKRCEGSTQCLGNAEEKEPCNVKLCIGSWGDWGTWSDCSVTCNGGTRSRSRTCEDGDHCLGGSYEEHRPCGTEPCIVPVNCGWCAPTTQKRQVEGRCRYEEVQTRTPSCPAVQGTGTPCTGETTINKRDVTVFGQQRQRDFHGNDPEKNVFSVTCSGGCVTIYKVVHWCYVIPNVPADLKKVQDLCEGKETCRFTPATSFFGQRGCNGLKKTWITYGCNNGQLTENHKDGNKAHHHNWGFRFKLFW